jgi:hypothetical protein
MSCFDHIYLPWYFPKGRFHGPVIETIYVTKNGSSYTILAESGAYKEKPREANAVTGFSLLLKA